jgi:hypothetical protein
MLKTVLQAPTTIQAVREADDDPAFFSPSFKRQRRKLIQSLEGFPFFFHLPLEMQSTILALTLQEKGSDLVADEKKGEEEKLREAQAQLTKLASVDALKDCFEITWQFWVRQLSKSCVEPGQRKLLIKRLDDKHEVRYLSVGSHPYWCSPNTSALLPLDNGVAFLKEQHRLRTTLEGKKVKKIEFFGSPRRIGLALHFRDSTVLFLESVCTHTHSKHGDDQGMHIGEDKQHWGGRFVIMRGTECCATRHMLNESFHIHDAKLVHLISKGTVLRNGDMKENKDVGAKSLVLHFGKSAPASAPQQQTPTRRGPYNTNNMNKIPTPEPQCASSPCSHIYTIQAFWMCRAKCARASGPYYQDLQMKLMSKSYYKKAVKREGGWEVREKGTQTNSCFLPVGLNDLRGGCILNCQGFVHLLKRGGNQDWLEG